MPSSLLRNQTGRLRAIAERLGLEPVAALAHQMGVQAVHRVTVRPIDRAISSTVATVRQTRIEGALLTLHFEGALGGKPLVSTFPLARMEALTRALAAADFDRLLDPPDLPVYDTVDLWLIERAAGAFTHSAIVVPGMASGAYAALEAVIRQHLPEALRTLRAGR
jgi:hypothetical protein